MKPWRPAVRMARRDLRRHKVRALLTCLLVALPIFAGTYFAQLESNNRWDVEDDAAMQMFEADGRLVVSDHTSVRPREALNGNPAKTRDAEPRDPAAVDLAALLPGGTDVVRRPWESMVPLTTGGALNVLRADTTSPLLGEVVHLTDGRLPRASDEVVVPTALAREFGLLTPSGDLEAGARTDLFAGQTLSVVGVMDRGRSMESWDFGVLVPDDSLLPPSLQPGYEPRNTYLVDLPELTRPQTRALVDDLAAQGVALQPRDTLLHPRAWGLGDYEPGSVVDITPLVTGAFCVLLGLIEVVLLVGAAFSVAARRQIRDLGLLATNGGAPSDVRRVVLAQGLVLGVVSSVVGAAAGVVVFLLTARWVGDRLALQTQEPTIDWLATIGIALLGSLTAVVAALVPAWQVSRVTPVDSLNGRFPVRPGESRAHRPAFVLAGTGALTLVAGGWALATAKDRYPNWVDVSAVGAGFGLVLLVVGVVWSTPYVVHRLARLSRRLPLSARYAFRDAGRHRFRTAAAVTALMITVAGAVLAGFAFSSAARDVQAGSYMPPRTFAAEGLEAGADPDARIASLTSTVDRILEPETVTARYGLLPGTNPNSTVVMTACGCPVEVVDEDSLRALLHVDEAAIATFRAGGIVTNSRGAVREGSARITAVPGRNKPDNQRTLPAATVTGQSWPVDALVLVSADTARSLGYVPSYLTMAVRNAEPITQDQVDRLRLYGIYGWSEDPDQARFDLLRYAGLGAAGVLTALVVGIAVALAAAEGRDDVATLAAVGAGPWRRRGFGAMHGLFLGLVGTALGLGVGVPAGMALTQVDGYPGVDVAWLPTLGTAVVVLLLSWVMGAVVTPSRFRLTRRVA